VLRRKKDITGQDHDKWHEGYYSKLKRNDGGSCCNLMDCRPTQSRMVGDHYEVKVDGEWVPVPNNKINNVVAPDGGAHVCAPRQEGRNKGVSASFFRRRADAKCGQEPAVQRRSTLHRLPEQTNLEARRGGCQTRPYGMRGTRTAYASAFFTRSGRNGVCRSRTPVSSAIALEMHGAIKGVAI
jgi:hypothetical protein